MLVTAAVFQSTMLPYVVVAAAASVTHAVTAVPMLLFVMAVKAWVPGAMSCTITAGAAQRLHGLRRREVVFKGKRCGTASPTTHATAHSTRERGHTARRRILDAAWIVGTDRMVCGKLRHVCEGQGMGGI